MERWKGDSRAAVKTKMIAPEHQAEWERDCLQWLGRVLTGKFCHWCYDWDGLPVDETTSEWQGCTCEFEDEK